MHPLRTIGAVGTVMRREYVQRIRTKTFVFTTVAAPILLLGLAGISGYLAAGVAETERELAVIDHTGVLLERIQPRLRDAGFRVLPVHPDEAASPALERRLREGELAGALLLDERTLTEGRAVWRGADGPPALRGLALRHALTQTALEVRLLELDGEGALEPLLGAGRLDVEALDDDGASRAAAVGVALAGALFLYFVLLVYGTMVLRAVQEEKTTRIVETVISAIRPWQLMLGKILGVGGVGLTQLVIWMVAGGLLLGVALPAALPLAGDLELPPELVGTATPGPGVAAFFVVSFLAGYFIYASLFAAVGAICSTEEEAQQLQVPVVLMVLVPFLFMIPVLDAPDSTFAVWMSLFPFFSPVLMFARVALGAAPAWQALLSVVLMLAALFVTALAAGRIYRTGILMQGKRPSVPEIWRWVREG